VRDLLDHYHRLRQTRRAELVRPGAPAPEVGVAPRPRPTQRREASRTDTQGDRS
jgi:hypothetical protein